MFATAPAHKQTFFGALWDLKSFRLNLALSRQQAHPVDREEVVLNRMSPHTLDVLELMSDEGCVSEWGLVERAARLRDGWA